MDEQSDADDFERAILRSELDAAPPAAAENEVLSRVLAAVVPIPPGGPGPSGPALTATGGALAKGAATLGGLGKGFALGIGVSIAAVSGSHLLGTGSPWHGASPKTAASLRAPEAPMTVPAPLERTETLDAKRKDSPSAPAARPEVDSRAPSGSLVGAIPTVTAEPPAAERTPGASSVASFPATDDAALASRLREEAALLRRARAELRAGSLAAAFATLEASRRQFTAPELAQEREALAIELLHRSGERAVAALRAREFLARYPDSPHAAAVRVFLADAGR